jgi:hypothetical protein
LNVRASAAVAVCSQGLQPGGRAISPTATATGSPGEDPDPTVPVDADVADAEPAALLAVTETRKVEPTSALVRRYDEAVSPVPEQELPLHRCH